jgi:quercetin dioxygenase-like cupin family protein
MNPPPQEPFCLTKVLQEAVRAENQVSEDEVFSVLINRLAATPLFADVHEWEVKGAWQRPVRPQTFKYFKFVRSTPETYLRYAAFTTNRMLTALHEASFLFLPESQLKGEWAGQSFYNEEFRTLSALVTPALQKYALKFVDENVTVSGQWTKKKFLDYFQERITPLLGRPRSLELIEKSNYPVQAAELLLMQHGLDFLVEASHMARYVLGDFGKLQSHLFRVLLDEYGYGVHERKHSSLFKAALNSVGLRTNTHAYWQFYLNTSFLLNNYFHRITRQQEEFFQYLGAITLAENLFGPYCRHTAATLQKVYGEKVDVRYYHEHAHIDQHHGRMTLEEMLLPAIDLYGEEIIRNSVLGIEQTLYLQDLAEKDLCAQITWMSKKDDYHQLGMEIKDAVLAKQDQVNIMRLIEPKGELSVTHVHDGDELCIVNSGVLRFISGPNSYVDLQPGQAVVIKKNRLHGAIVLSEVCHYNIYSIGDYRRYADRDI